MRDLWFHIKSTQQQLNTINPTRQRNKLEMCNISRITSANLTPLKKECSVAVNYSPNMLKTIWSCWGRCRACRSALEWEMSSSSFWKRNTGSPSTGICLGILCSLPFRWLLSCIRRIDLLFTSGSDAGFDNLWVRRLKVTKVTNLFSQYQSNAFRCLPSTIV